MNEFQYFEFQAIDRILTKDEFEALRGISKQARITSSSFAAIISDKAFPVDPLVMVEKSFDAFVYTADWGTRQFVLRIPGMLFDPGTLSRYCPGQSFVHHTLDDHVLLDYLIEGDPYWGQAGEGWLASLVQLRACLMNGDLRCLYLGWLLCLQMGDLAEEDMEPPVPPGLATLNAPLRRLVEFLQIDPDLFEVASKNSPSEKFVEQYQQELEAWIAHLDESEKNALMLRMIKDNTALMVNDILKRFRKALEEYGGVDVQPERRTVADIQAYIEEQSKQRKREEAKQRARERAKQEQKGSFERENYLKRLGKRESSAWKSLDDMIDGKRPPAYEKAIELISDLRDVAQRNNQLEAYREKIKNVADKHSRKYAFIRKLQDLDLLS